MSKLVTWAPVTSHFVTQVRQVVSILTFRGINFLCLHRVTEDYRKPDLNLST